MALLRLVFMGSAEFAVPTLLALLDAGHDIAAVYTQPPRPAGRGQRERPCPVHAFAEDRTLPVRLPYSLNDKADQEAFRELGADAAVVAAYGLLLPKPILETPRLGCFNVHASLLPRWRGAAPIQRAILAGDDKSGVTIMHMDEGLDTGPVLMSSETPIDGATTASGLHDRLAELGAGLMVMTLDRVSAGKIGGTPQPEDGITYADKLEKKEGRIDWQRPAAELERAVRALSPWPGVWFEHGGEQIKVLAANAVTLPPVMAPGTVIGPALIVACGNGGLTLNQLQRPGRAALDTAEFLRGYRLPPGTVLT